MAASNRMRRASLKSFSWLTMPNMSKDFMGNCLSLNAASQRAIMLQLVLSLASGWHATRTFSAVWLLIVYFLYTGWNQPAWDVYFEA